MHMFIGVMFNKNLKYFISRKYDIRHYYLKLSAMLCLGLQVVVMELQ